MKKALMVVCLLLSLDTFAQSDKDLVKENFTKTDTVITMRDGIKLKTIIYIPKDETQKFPFLIERTP